MLKKGSRSKSGKPNRVMRMPNAARARSESLTGMVASARKITSCSGSANVYPASRRNTSSRAAGSSAFRHKAASNRLSANTRSAKRRSADTRSAPAVAAVTRAGTRTARLSQVSVSSLLWSRGSASRRASSGAFCSERLPSSSPSPVPARSGWRSARSPWLPVRSLLPGSFIAVSLATALDWARRRASSFTFRASASFTFCASASAGPVPPGGVLPPARRNSADRFAGPRDTRASRLHSGFPARLARPVRIARGCRTS